MAGVVVEEGDDGGDDVVAVAVAAAVLSVVYDEGAVRLSSASCIVSHQLGVVLEP